MPKKASGKGKKGKIKILSHTEPNEFRDSPLPLLVRVSTDGVTSPDPIYAKPGDTVQWDPLNGTDTVSVSFDKGDGDPFGGLQGPKHTHPGKTPTPAVVKHSKQRHYRYNITVNTRTYDPVIVIDP